MEASLKKDVLRELRAGEGRLLLHDEVEERPGQFEIIPLWENIDEGDIMTPRDVFALMKTEGFKVRSYVAQYCYVLKLFRSIMDESQ